MSILMKLAKPILHLSLIKVTLLLLSCDNSHWGKLKIVHVAVEPSQVVEEYL